MRHIKSRARRRVVVAGWISDELVGSCSCSCPLIFHVAIDAFFGSFRQTHVDTLFSFSSSASIHVVSTLISMRSSFVCICLAAAFANTQSVADLPSCSVLSPSSRLLKSSRSLSFSSVVSLLLYQQLHAVLQITRASAQPQLPTLSSNL